MFTTASVCSVVQHCSGPNLGQKWGVWAKISLAPPLAARNQFFEWPSCQTEALSEMVPFHGASRGPILVNIRPFWSSIFQIRVVWEVSGGLRRRYCSKDRTYCYCSVQRFQCCSVVTVNTSNSVHPLTFGNPSKRIELGCRHGSHRERTLDTAVVRGGGHPVR